MFKNHAGKNISKDSIRISLCRKSENHFLVIFPKISMQSVFCIFMILNLCFRIMGDHVLSLLIQMYRNFRHTKRTCTFGLLKPLPGKSGRPGKRPLYLLHPVPGEYSKPFRYREVTSMNLSNNNRM